jgi:hypothetical protein
MAIILQKQIRRDRGLPKKLDHAFISRADQRRAR